MAGIDATEAQVQAACLDYLAMKGYFFFRLNNMPIFNKAENTFRRLPKYTPKGLPDTIEIKEGHFIGLEFKRKGTKLSPEQIKCAQGILHAGGSHHTDGTVEQFL